MEAKQINQFLSNYQRLMRTRLLRQYLEYHKRNILMRVTQRVNVFYANEKTNFFAPAYSSYRKS